MRLSGPGMLEKSSVRPRKFHTIQYYQPESAIPSKPTDGLCGVNVFMHNVLQLGQNAEPHRCSSLSQELASTDGKSTPSNGVDRAVQLLDVD